MNNWPKGQLIRDVVICRGKSLKIYRFWMGLRSISWLVG